ncbi:sporulation-specific protein 15-like isoform X1 [Homalodisca vitripennis]|uniref:sporulation-specific protein 15-like isoform X1 n=1 Tax=Homalodisca vitripennis TaxID=197043 RepID=UPI001EEB1895|nr:sporulation-specific protein 15-like isoform X1 [Homalodisca vitripennis]
MVSLPFKEKVLDLLSATGYSLNLKQDQLSSIELNSELKPFFDWFIQNISQENCITSDELDEFRKLEENGKALYGRDLDEAVQAFHNQPVENLLPCAELYNETMNDEVAHLKEQLRLKEDLHTVVKSSVSAVTEDITELREECRKAEARRTEILKDVVAENKKLSNKLQEVMTVLHNLRESLSELQDHGCEISADEGIDTYLSDKLNTSISLSSLQSLQSTYSEKNSGCKYLCQLSLHKYEENQKSFSSIIDSMIQKGLTNVGQLKDEDMDVELELQSIMDRLCIQKKEHIKMLARLEGMKAAHDKLEEISRELKSTTQKPTLSELRDGLLDFEENSIDLNESFDRNIGEVNETCALWAEHLTLRPIHDLLTTRIEHFKFVNNKMDELISALKMKKIADETLREMIEWEVEQIQVAIETYLSVQKMLKEWLESTMRRLDVMAVNVRDYADHCSLPVDERSKLVKWLAQITGSDKKCVPETVMNLTEYCQSRHQALSDQSNQQLQTIMSVEHKMKDFYSKEVLDREVQNRFNPKLLTNIQKTLEEMSNEITELTEHCQSRQVNDKEFEEKKEVQDMLNKLIQSSQ